MNVVPEAFFLTIRVDENGTLLHFDNGMKLQFNNTEHDIEQVNALTEYETMILGTTAHMAREFFSELASALETIYEVRFMNGN